MQSNPSENTDMTPEPSVDFSSAISRRRQKIGTIIEKGYSPDVESAVTVVENAWLKMNAFQHLLLYLGVSFGDRAKEFNKAALAATEISDLAAINREIREIIIKKNPDLAKTNACLIAKNNLPGLIESITEVSKSLEEWSLRDKFHIASGGGLAPIRSMQQEKLQKQINFLMNRVESLHPIKIFTGVPDIELPTQTSDSVLWAASDLGALITGIKNISYTEKLSASLDQLKASVVDLSAFVDKHLFENSSEVNKLQKILSSVSTAPGETADMSDADDLGCLIHSIINRNDHALPPDVVRSISEAVNARNASQIDVSSDSPPSKNKTQPR